MWLATICRDADILPSEMFAWRLKTPCSPIHAPGGSLSTLADSATYFEIHQDGKSFMLADNSANRFLAIAFVR